MDCESSVPLGTCIVFHVKMKLEAIPQCINQCDRDLKMHETNGWVQELQGRAGGSAVFLKARGSAEMQYNSPLLLPCMQLLSTDLDHLSCYLPRPCLSITQNFTLCFQ